jgi:hypothetical protein
MGTSGKTTSWFRREARAVLDSLTLDLLMLSWILKTSRGSKHNCRKSLTSVILSRLDVQAVCPRMNFSNEGEGFIPPTKVMKTVARFISKFDLELHRNLLSSWHQGV